MRMLWLLLPRAGEVTGKGLWPEGSRLKGVADLK